MPLPTQHVVAGDFRNQKMTERLAGNCATSFIFRFSLAWPSQIFLVEFAMGAWMFHVAAHTRCKGEKEKNALYSKRTVLGHQEFLLSACIR